MKKIFTLMLIGIISISSIIVFADEDVEVNNVIEVSTNISNTNGKISVEGLVIGNKSVYYNDKLIDLSRDVLRKNIVTYLPLRSVLSEMGYNVKWNGEKSSVEIFKGANWTEIYVGRNSYFKNKMSSYSLSSAPIIEDGIVMVPLEFFSEILGKTLKLVNGNIVINDGQVAIHDGYITDITVSRGYTNITISKKKGSKDPMDIIVIHTSRNMTVFNSSMKVGDKIRAICPPVMTMSIPAQTSAYIIYKTLK